MFSYKNPRNQGDRSVRSLIAPAKVIPAIFRSTECIALGLVMIAFVFVTAAVAETPRKKTVREEPEATTPKKKTTQVEPALNVKKPEVEEGALPVEKSMTVSNASIVSTEIREFDAQPAAVKKLIESCLELAKQNFTYTYGSSDPANGGFDCSGFIYYVLRQHGFAQVPRDSSGQYVWVRSARGFRAVIGRKMDGFEMDELLPGDLLFWTGTYATAHDPPISHVMLYLGTEKSTGAKVMIGSSDGRTYRNQRRNGVSVFDFKLPKAAAKGDAQSVFVGYGRIPGLRD